MNFLNLRLGSSEKCTLIYIQIRSVRSDVLPCIQSDQTTILTTPLLLTFSAAGNLGPGVMTWPSSAALSASLISAGESSEQTVGSRKVAVIADWQTEAPPCWNH